MVCRTTPAERNATTVKDDFQPVELDESGDTCRSPVVWSIHPVSPVPPSNDSDTLGAEQRYCRSAEDGAGATDTADLVELGRGGNGQVFLAHDRHLGRDVAWKQLLPEHVAKVGRSNAERRFSREARIACQLEHPNIVTVYDMGRCPKGELYYTMRLVRGRTLCSAIARATTLESRLALLGHFSGLCQAIAYAHSEGVVHRDIKPENVMLGEFGETVVLDWGGAQVLPKARKVGLSPSIPPATPRRRWIGTPSYMSPEQVDGRLCDVDERSDVWALGVVLYQVLSGAFPFEGDTFADLAHNVATRDAIPLLSRQRRIAPELAAIAERALCKDPEGRYRNAGEMMRDIEAYRAGSDVSAYSYSPWQRVRRLACKHQGPVVAFILTALAWYSLALGG